jgi:hypothetical protein
VDWAGAKSLPSNASNWSSSVYEGGTNPDRRGRRGSTCGGPACDGLCFDVQCVQRKHYVGVVVEVQRFRLSIVSGGWSRLYEEAMAALSAGGIGAARGWERSSDA